MFSGESFGGGDDGTGRADDNLRLLGPLDLKVWGGGERRLSSRTLTGDRGGGSVSTI